MPELTARSGVEPWRRRLYLPAYMVSDAARYARIPPQTIAYWHYGGGGLGPALPSKEYKQRLSYLQLVEVAFVATFRALGVPLQRIRRAREYVAQTLNSEFPFAEYRWLTEGHHMILDLWAAEQDTAIKKVIVGDQAGQIAWQQMVGDRFAEFDYEHGLALIWHVAGRQSPVVIDPRIAFGAPTIRGRGIPTWVLKGRWQAGESMDDIQEDFEVDKDEITSALTFEGISLAA